MTSNQDLKFGYQCDPDENCGRIEKLTSIRPKDHIVFIRIISALEKVEEEMFFVKVHVTCVCPGCQWWFIIDHYMYKGDTHLTVVSQKLASLILALYFGKMG
jgi:hypothetical protein